MMRIQLNSLFDPEDEGDIFPRNVGYLRLTTPRYNPEAGTLRNYHYENLKYYIVRDCHRCCQIGAT
jgi:hypothetical protein